MVVVTKYFDAPTTHKILEQVAMHPAFWGLGENRVEDIKAKKLPPQKVHFIGNIQSRKIKDIVQLCSVVHSVSSIDHVIKMEKEAQKCGKLPPKAFIQVNISGEVQKEGISAGGGRQILNKIIEQSKIEIVGLSAMGKGEFKPEEKMSEFQKLIDLRNKYCPQGMLSAGTSRDYKIALQMGIEVVRVGRACFEP